MQPLFTIHAGEYLVGSHIESKYKKWNVWVPSKDSGIDLLVTDKSNKKTASIQVKFSKDFLVTHGRPKYQRVLKSCGWWSLNPKKMEESTADFWIFVLHTFNEKNQHYVIVPKAGLLTFYGGIHDLKANRVQSYIWVTKDDHCWETRNLSQRDQDLIAQGEYVNPDRDLTTYLNNWQPIEHQLS